MESRIVKFYKHGGPEELKIVKEITPFPKKNEVRINVKAIGLNQAESMLREGKYVASPNLPSRIGVEATGIIDAIGTNVSKWKIGDTVCAIPFLSWDKNGNWTADSINQYGVYGEIAIVPDWTITKKASNQSYEEAAASWCQYLTAWGGLVNDVNLKNKSYCIFTGASSSAAIGGMQVAKLFGLKSFAVSRTNKKKEALLEAGYDEVLTLEDPQLEQNIMDLTKGLGFDIAYDCVGGEFFSKLLNTSKSQGLIVNYGNLNTKITTIKTLHLLSKRLNIRFHSIFDTMRNPNQRDQGIEWVNSQIEKGTLCPLISKVFSLEKIVEAHKYIASGVQIGKTIVIT